MMSKRTVKEVYLLRSIACVCVVLLHSITRVVELYDSQLASYQETSLMTLRLLLTFGTPVFIFLSEFLLSYSYAEEIPKNFMKKRIQLIILPYISMSFIYAVLMTHEANNFVEGTIIRTFGMYVMRNLLFGFYRHGYFIIVVFQFYLLHLLLHRHLSSASPKKVLSISLMINLIYLGFFNFVEPFNIPYGQYIWHGLSWGSFLSWIFYFALGYYCGKYYDDFIKILRYHRRKVILLPFLAATVVGYLYLSEILTMNDSKRIDMIFFATSMIFFIYYIAVKMKGTPNIFIIISRFSFSIYLLHMVFLYLGVQLVQNTSYINLHPLSVLSLLFIGSIAASIISTLVISKFSIGKYIVGRINRPKETDIKPVSKKTVWISKEFIENNIR